MSVGRSGSENRALAVTGGIVVRTYQYSRSELGYWADEGRTLQLTGCGNPEELSSRAPKSVAALLTTDLRSHISN